MNAGELLLAAALAAPFAVLAAGLSRRLRYALSPLAALAPLPAFLAAVFCADATSLSAGSAQVRVSFVLDLPGRVLLGSAALLWIAAGSYAVSYLRDTAHRDRFTAWWLLAMGGCLGAFVSADMLSFYLLLALVSIGSCGLVVHTETPAAWRSGGIYLGLALLGESIFLMGLILLAGALPADGRFLLRDAAAALPGMAQRDLILALLIAGLGLKTGLVPLHFWIPLAHAAAPIPASAVLSGTAVKVGLIGLIRLLPLAETLPAWGMPLAAVGLFGALYGVAIGLTQGHPKAVLAYSTVSQMGLIVAVLGMGMVDGDAIALPAAAFYATHHVLVKGALFLAVGLVAATARSRAMPLLAAVAVLALALGGLPLTGGGLAKFAVKGPLGDGVAKTIATLSAAGTTLLMLHFLRRLLPLATSGPHDVAPRGLFVPWLVAAAGSVIVPWALYLTVPSSLNDVLAASVLWSTLWPMLVGVVLAVALARVSGRLPVVPEGDIAVLLDRAARSAGAWSRRIDRADGALRQWPAATLSLLLLAGILAASMITLGGSP